jgi:hypothetical protein
MGAPPCPPLEKLYPIQNGNVSHQITRIEQEML